MLVTLVSYSDKVKTELTRNTSFLLPSEDFTFRLHCYAQSPLPIAIYFFLYDGTAATDETSRTCP